MRHLGGWENLFGQGGEGVMKGIENSAGTETENNEGGD